MGALASRLRRALGAAPAGQNGYTFDLADEAAWLGHLRGKGYCVIRAVGSDEQVRTARDLLWESIRERDGGTVRGDPETWNFSVKQSGLVPWLSQTAGAWAVRGWPGVKRAFAAVWETEELIVSMDAVIVWKPWWLKKGWRPMSEGLHLDQNPFHKVGLECVQGMVPLLPVTAATGGLRVVPGSNQDEDKEEFRQEHQHMKFSGDWCPCDDDYLQKRAALLHACPGDLILWDSRTVHGGFVGSGQGEGSGDGQRPAELARLAVTVAMTPRAWAGEHVLQRRLEGFRKGENFNHVPHEAGTSNGTVRAPVRRGFRPPELSEEQRALL